MRSKILHEMISGDIDDVQQVIETDLFDGMSVDSKAMAEYAQTFQAQECTPREIDSIEKFVLEAQESVEEQIKEEKSQAVINEFLDKVAPDAEQ